MNDRTRILIAVAVTVVLFLAVQLGALALVEPFHDADRQAVDNPDDPTNSLIFFGVILLATVVMLAAFKYDVQWFIRGLIIAVSTMLAWFVFTELIPTFVTIAGWNVIAVGAALAVGLGLLIYPEWYVIDVAAVLMGAGAAGLFGISFGLLPAIVFLVILAIYDAISVYKTRHMLSLASGVMDLNIPVVFVVPTTLSFSFRSTDSGPTSIDADSTQLTSDADDATAVRSAETESQTSTDIQPEPTQGDDESPNTPNRDEDSPEALERDALFIGLGDAVIPTILVVSAAYFVPVGTIDVPIIALNLAALGAIVGTLTGLLILLSMVLKGKPHAGLPLLNGGAICGYLIGAIASGLSIATAIGL